jgi:thymidine kinase
MFTLILGPMKSGKSLELIARMAPYEFADQEVLYIQPLKNVRDKGIASRIGIDAKAATAGSLSEITASFDVIGIDEIHMFSPDDVTAVEAWIKQEKSIFISGLDLDYRGQMPAIIKNLFELKPDIIAYKIAVCDVCRQYRAQFTQILHDDEPVLSGLPTIVPEDGTYEYQARCRDCFLKETNS